LEREGERFDHIAVGRPATVHPPLDERYGEVVALSDGLGGDIGQLNTMAGLRGSDMTVTIDLGESLLVERVRAGFLHRPDIEAFLPTELFISVSLDGRRFDTKGRLKPRTATSFPRDTIEYFELIMRAKPARYLRVVAKNRRKASVRSSGIERGAWLFCDEIMVE
jgi:hexosaminidase